MDAKIIPYYSLEIDYNYIIPTWKFMIPYDIKTQQLDMRNPNTKVAMRVIYKNRWYYIIDPKIYIRITCEEAGRKPCGAGFKRYYDGKVAYWLRPAILPPEVCNPLN